MDTIQSIKNITQNDINLLIKQNKDTRINNINFTFLGKGGEGVVYKLGLLPIAMKIYKKKSHKNKEIYVLKKLNKLAYNNFLQIHSDLNLFGHSVLFMDLIDGNLEKWVETSHSHKEWMIMIFQILHGLFILQNELKMCHTDMKPKNILFKKVEKKLNKISIDSNNIFEFKSRYVFIIGDYGHCQSLLFNNNDMTTNSIELCIENNLDLKQLSVFHKRLAVTIITKHYTLENILDIGKNDEHFVEYVKWIKSNIEKDMKDYNSAVKHHMLIRDLSYYLLEKEYLNINDLPVIEGMGLKIVLPPQEIITQLESLAEVKGKNSLKNKLIEIGKIININ